MLYNIYVLTNKEVNNVMNGTWQINFGNMNQSNVDFMNICKEHPGCEDCPLKTEDKEINGTLFRCHTGRGEVR